MRCFHCNHVKILAMFRNGVWSLRSIMWCSLLPTWRYYCICDCKMNKSIMTLKSPLLIVLSSHFFPTLKFGLPLCINGTFFFHLSRDIFHLYLGNNNYLVHTFRNYSCPIFLGKIEYLISKLRLLLLQLTGKEPISAR